MRVCILGWYGTETIGDRAILAGIFSLLNATFKDFSIELGSLYPYFSERTVMEDAEFFKKTLGKDISIRIFDSRESKQLENAVAASDLVAVGGGPLMHINAMFMLEYAFKLARKKRKKTMLFGCGVGPLHKRRHQKSAVTLAENCDFIVLRDSVSRTHLHQLSGGKLDLSKILVSLDPAVQCMLDFQKLNSSPTEENFIAVNMRSFPQEYSADKKGELVNDSLKDFLLALTEKFPDKKIRLIPMHYFHIGDDDRDFLNSLAIQLDSPNIEVQNVNLNLEQTMAVFQQASLNIGMRFHSVVFQTVLSGKNIVLDYTEPEKGKIGGFLNDIGGMDFYKNRYINLQNVTGSTSLRSLFDELDATAKFAFDKEAALRKMEVYLNCLKTLA